MKNGLLFILLLSLFVCIYFKNLIYDQNLHKEPLKLDAMKYYSNKYLNENGFLLRQNGEGDFAMVKSDMFAIDFSGKMFVDSMKLAFESSETLAPLYIYVNMYVSPKVDKKLNTFLLTFKDSTINNKLPGKPLSTYYSTTYYTLSDGQKIIRSESLIESNMEKVNYMILPKQWPYELSYWEKFKIYMINLLD